MLSFLLILIVLQGSAPFLVVDVRRDSRSHCLITVNIKTFHSQCVFLLKQLQRKSRFPLMKLYLKQVSDPQLNQFYLNYDRVNHLDFGLFNYVLIWFSALILHAITLETCAIAFIMPVSECDLNLTQSQKGILGGAAFFGIICSSYLWGFLADTKGRRSVIQPTLLIAALLSIIGSFVQNFYIFAALRFLNGFL